MNVTDPSIFLASKILCGLFVRIGNHMTKAQLDWYMVEVVGDHGDRTVDSLFLQ